ncbi:MAG: hypothetical protein KF887_15940 [Paracoccaceae bacterium]|nr:MAG: hypothetical protein KF887_15940 [Paracoccaceae bacterium]
MKAFALLFMLAALEEPSPGWPDDGCYARDYDAAHLRSHPAQVVRTMHLSVNHGPAVGFHAMLHVTLADQGHAGRDGLGGRAFEQGLFCDGDRGAVLCVTECPGDGALTITRDDAGMLEFTTDFLLVGPRSACPRATDLAEVPGVAVTYRLARVPDADCEAP